jgi:hypothetical protein
MRRKNRNMMVNRNAWTGNVARVVYIFYNPNNYWYEWIKFRMFSVTDGDEKRMEHFSRYFNIIYTVDFVLSTSDYTQTNQQHAQIYLVLSSDILVVPLKFLDVNKT